MKKTDEFPVFASSQIYLIFAYIYWSILNYVSVYIL